MENEQNLTEMLEDINKKVNIDIQEVMKYIDEILNNEAK